MKYINTEDLISIIQEQLINSSIATAAQNTIEDSAIIDDIESKTIDLVISYIAPRYDHTLIFDDVSPIRNGVLVQIIASIVVYRCIRRNAARKVPEDYLKLYTDSIKDLEKIQSGAMNLINCPVPVPEDGYTPGVIWGNNTNDNFFI